jgi:hypothetical protein
MSYYDEDVFEIDEFGMLTDYYDDFTKVVEIPDYVSSIYHAFSGHSEIEHVILPRGLSDIEECAFEGCTNLKSIEIPKDVYIIDENAFYRCSGLESISVEEGNSYFHVTDNCLIATKSKILIRGCKSSRIPSDGSVTVIGNSAFSGCVGLKSIEIPGCIKTIEDGAFCGCSDLECITVAPDNAIYHSKDNCLIKTESKTLICACKNSIIPTDGSVTKIDDFAFSGCKGLTSITIPGNVTEIGRYAFCDCENLTSITLSDGLESIAYYAFSECINLTHIEIPSSITKIDQWGLRGNKNLTSVTIPASVTSIDRGAFDYCSNLVITAPADSYAAKYAEVNHIELNLL